MVSTRLLTIPILAVLMAGVAAAQASDAEIAGLITDPSGAAIAGAGVTLVNQDSGFTRNSTADPEGRYRFVALAPAATPSKSRPRDSRPRMSATWSSPLAHTSTATSISPSATSRRW